MKRWLALILTACVVLGAGSAMADKTLTFSFAGDVTLGSEEAYRSREDSFDSYAAREGYEYFFKKVKPIFEADDLTLVNLEGVLSDKSWNEDKRKTFRFRGPTDFAKILTVSSIEACAISNNHIMDFGNQGYQATRDTLDANGIYYCGNEYHFIFEKDGIRVGFFAVGSMYFNRYRKQIQEDIAQMREDGVNAIIVSFHAGQEYSPHRRDRDQETDAQIAIETWGADLVIMHHPHVVQGIDILNNRYVFYSLGNFCFGGNWTVTGKNKDPKIRALESMIVQMDLVFDDDGNYKGQSGRIYPCYISSSAKQKGDPNDYQPCLVYGDEALGVLERIQNDTEFDLGLLDDETGILNLPYLDAAETAENAEGTT